MNLKFPNKLTGVTGSSREKALAKKRKLVVLVLLLISIPVISVLGNNYIISSREKPIKNTTTQFYKYLQGMNIDKPLNEIVSSSIEKDLNSLGKPELIIKLEYITFNDVDLINKTSAAVSGWIKYENDPTEKAFGAKLVKEYGNWKIVGYYSLDGSSTNE